MTCPVCRGPAYVGLLRIECINPECKPFDPTSCVYISEAPAPRADCVAYEGEWWSYRSVIMGERRDGRAFWVNRDDCAAFGYPRPTREECFVAWAKDHPERVAMEPARLTFRALCLAHPAAADALMASIGVGEGCCIPIDDHGGYEGLAWKLYEATR